MKIEDYLTPRQMEMYEEASNIAREIVKIPESYVIHAIAKTRKKDTLCKRVGVLRGRVDDTTIFNFMAWSKTFGFLLYNDSSGIRKWFENYMKEGNAGTIYSFDDIKQINDILELCESRGVSKKELEDIVKHFRDEFLSRIKLMNFKDKKK